MKALILTCSTGEGHNSAARGVKDALEARGITAVIFDPLTLAKHDASKKAANSYNKLISKAPGVFGFIYKLGDIYEYSKLPNPVYNGNASYANKLAKMIADENYDFVISTHLFGMEAMTEVKRKYNRNIKSYGVLTDYTTIPFYNETELDGYFVPTMKVKMMLHKKSIPIEKIYVTGIPVQKKFANHVDRAEAKKKLGIDEKRQVVTLLSGGAGCGKIVELIKNFEKKLPENVDVYVFPGRNEKLQNLLHKKFDKFDNIKIVPFTPEIDMYMKASDVILSKPGGLSSTEIAVVGVPFVHLKAVPGCESANIIYFGGAGLSLPSPSVKKAVRNSIVLLKDKPLADCMIECQNKLIRKDSGDLILDTILSQLEK